MVGFDLYFVLFFWEGEIWDLFVQLAMVVDWFICKSIIT